MPVEISNLTGTFRGALYSGFTQFMNTIPLILGAAIILVVGWFVAKLIGRAVERILMMTRFDHAVAKARIYEYMPRRNNGDHYEVSTFVGVLCKWFVFLMFVQSAAAVMGMGQISIIINDVIRFIPNIVVAVAFIIFGSWAASYCSELVAKSTSQTGISSLVRYGILGFAVIAAMGQLGIATNLINILFTGLVASLSLAFGLAFGLGGRNAARDITQNFLDKTPRSLNSVSTTETEDLPHH